MKDEERRRELIAARAPLLILVINFWAVDFYDLHDIAESAAAAGVSALELREKEHIGEDLVEGACRLRGGAPDALLFLNAEYDTMIWGLSNDAVLFDDQKGLDGIHLIEHSERSLRRARRDVGTNRLLLKSVHGHDAAVRAERDGADLLVLGTVFPSSSHPGGPTIGLDGVREVCDAVSIPVVGIGGITAQNAGDVIRAGASGVAVISAIFDADDPRTAAAELREAIDAAWLERQSSSPD